MSKYIMFNMDHDRRFGGREVYTIVNKRSSAELGNVFYYTPWRQWTARFDDDAVWSQDCLTDVAEFLRSLPK